MTNEKNVEWFNEIDKFITERIRESNSVNERKIALLSSCFYFVQQVYAMMTEDELLNETQQQQEKTRFVAGLLDSINVQFQLKAVQNGDESKL